MNKKSTTKNTSKQVEEIQTTQTLTPTKKSKHNYKLSEEDKQHIVLEYYLNRQTSNVEDICSKYNISTRRLYQIVKDKKYQKELNNYITECKNNFSKKTTMIIDKAINQLNEKIQEGDANIKDLTTTIGILYDKNRLEQNLSTSNNSISINIKVEK